MNKKVYIAPVCEVIEMETNVSMLAASNTPGVGGDMEENDPGDMMSNRHRGEWGNLWGRGE